MLNKQIIIGRLGQDPETRYTQSNTAVTNFTVATSERFKDRNGEQQEKTEWHRVVAWGRLAEICSEYLRKGSLVYIEGPTETREWENKDGVKQYTKEVTAREMKMLGSKGGNQGGGQRQGPQGPSGQPGPSGVNLDDNFDELDDDLPF